MKQTILFLAGNAAGLFKFRVELLQKLLELDYKVCFAVPTSSYNKKIEELGCIYYETKVDRRGISPSKDLNLMSQYYRLINLIKPDLVLTYTIKPIIYGGIICSVTKTPYITNITGLGSGLYQPGWLQFMLLRMLRIALKNSKVIFFQNNNNYGFYQAHKLIQSRVRMVAGSGVNLSHHPEELYPEDNGTLKLLFVGRIMQDKGIVELITASEKLKQTHPHVEILVIGEAENEFKEKFAQLLEKNVVQYLGYKHNVHEYIKQAHAVILPSYAEGMSNALLEAAATGRPILASSVPGCQETFDEGITGLGFKPQNADDLYHTIVKFVNLPYEKKKEMGKLSHKKIENEFNRKDVIDIYLDEINNVIKKV